jgi:hypothetical protein
MANGQAFDMMPEGEFKELCFSDVRKTLACLGGQMVQTLHTGFDATVLWPDGSKWGLMIQTARILHESLQRTFEKKDQELLRSACAQENLIPVFALAFVTSDEPDKIQIVISKLHNILGMVNSKDVSWLSFSEKSGVIFHFSINKGYMKMIKSNPHVKYSSFSYRK